MFLPMRSFGFENERKAVALVFMGFYVALFGFLAFLIANLPPDPDFDATRPWWKCYAALSACYGFGFFALAANWFWGRWFAIGLAYSGVTTAIWAMISVRYAAPPLLIYGLTHGIIALCLQGEKLIAQYDLKPEWRAKFHLDEEGVYRVRKSVIRAVSSLPALIMFALAPREKTSFDSLALLGMVGVCIGLSGLLSARVWGVFVLVASSVTILLSGISSVPVFSFHSLGSSMDFGAKTFALLPLISFAFVLAAIFPMVKPMIQFLRKPTV